MLNKMIQDHFTVTNCQRYAHTLNAIRNGGMIVRDTKTNIGTISLRKVSLVFSHNHRNLESLLSSSSTFAGHFTGRARLDQLTKEQK